jgi:HAD superfamily hydrolase (TIGR01509 family)
MIRALSVLFFCFIAYILTAINPIDSKEHMHNHNNENIHVIFDVNGVLTQNSGAAKILGYRKFIAYFLLHHRNPFTIKAAIKQKLFHFLQEIKPRDPQEVAAYDEVGGLLPQIMCDWLKGTVNSAQLLKAVDDASAGKKRSLELAIITSIAKMMFTPELLIESQSWVPETIEFVKKLKKQGYKVYIFSNWDPSFALMKEKYPEIVGLFDDIVISGDIHLIKPDLNYYYRAIEKCGIDINRAIFFDDQEVNVKAAQSIGLASIQCTSTGLISSRPNIASLEKQFYAWRYTHIQDAATSNTQPV